MVQTPPRKTPKTRKTRPKPRKTPAHTAKSSRIRTPPTPPSRKHNPNAPVPLREEDIEAISKKMVAMLKTEARELSDHPGPDASQRTITRLLNDIHELQARARPSKPARFKLLKRIGRMLVSEAYRPILLAEIGIGKLLSILGAVGLFASFAQGGAMYYNATATTLVEKGVGVTAKFVTRADDVRDVMIVGITSAIIAVLGRKVQLHGRRGLQKLDAPSSPNASKNQKLPAITITMH
jgi:hypothetical protein